MCVIAYDKRNLLLYVTISQTFAIFFIPFYRPHARLTTVLQLVELPPPPLSPAPQTPPQSSLKPEPKYYILSQNDLYQVDQFVKFLSPLGLATLVVLVGQFFATFVCVLGALAGWPVSWVEENLNIRGSGRERLEEEVLEERERRMVGAKIQVEG